VTGAHIDDQERRSWKKSLTAADGVVQTRHRETTAAGYRNGEGGCEEGEREHGAMLMDRLDTENSCAF
jgi:hypothetical protein